MDDEAGRILPAPGAPGHGFAAPVSWTPPSGVSA